MRSAIARLRTLAWLLVGVRSDWPRRAETAARELLVADRFDVLLTTAGPFELVPVGFRLQRARGVPWVAELRDPARTNAEADDPLSRLLVRVRRAPLRRRLRAATEIVAATEQVRRIDGPWLARDLDLVVTGFDPAAWDSAEAEPPADAAREFRLVYAGKIYERYRRPDTVLAGLRRVEEARSASEPVPVVLSYLGRDGGLLRRLAAEHRVEHLVRDEGFVPPSEVPRRLKAADVLLLLTNEWGHSGVPGGKLFEYLGARRPILAVPGGDEVVATILERTGAGAVATTSGEVAHLLMSWYSAWLRTGELPGPPKASVEPYSAVHAAQSLADVLERASSKASPSSV